MTQQQHPVPPPPELVQQWFDEGYGLPGSISEYVATRAAQWAADQELEACCEWLDREGWSGESRQLRAARRPKPPSLKERSLKHLDVMERDGHYLPEILRDLRRALEQLDD